MSAAPAVAALPSAVPNALTRFVGREGEVAALAALLAGGDARLVTLAGPGGVGKTRLAAEVARAAAQPGGAAAGEAPFGDEVCWVDLAPLAEGALVRASVAAALGVREADAAEHRALALALGTRRVVLVLDNCEHVVGAVAALVEGLLRGAPGVRVLATSREPLLVEGERVWRVPVLSLPQGTAAGAMSRADALRSEAVRLFVERAREAQPAFALTEENAGAVAELCRRLDGLPLAIELAAARLRVLSVIDILRRLDDRFRLLAGGAARSAPTRQRALRALLDWSFDLLNARERAAFAALGVFPSSFSLAAAEAVCGREEQSGASPGPLDVLAQLVDKSLVQADAGPDGATRFRLLETVRAYALERLADAGDVEAVRRRHAVHFLALAETAELHLDGGEQVEWLDVLEQEIEHLRIALRYFRDAGETQSGLRLAVALVRFWHVRWYRVEGRDWLRAFLALLGSIESPREQPDHPLPEPRGPSALEAQATRDAAMLAWMTFDTDAAQALYERARGLFQALGDERGAALALDGLGLVALRRGDLERARALLDASRAVLRRTGDDWALALSLEHHGTLENRTGGFATARASLEEAVALLRRLGDWSLLTTALQSLGLAAYELGDLDVASAAFEEALRLARRLNYRVASALIQRRLGMLACRRGLLAAACAHYEQALGHGQRYGVGTHAVLAVEGIAEVALAAGRPARALELFGAAAGAWERLKMPGGRGLAFGRERDLALPQARAALPVEAERLLADGARRTLEEAVVLAHETLVEVTGAGESSAERAVAGAADRGGRPGGLTAREREVAALVAEGLTNRQIAERLVLSERTAENHVQHILSRLGFERRAQVAAWVAGGAAGPA